MYLFISLTFIFPCRLLAFTQQQDSSQNETFCLETFFSSIKPVPNPAKTMVILKNKKVVSVNKFINDINPYSAKGKKDMLESPVQSGLADLDKDGKLEMVINNFTGGAHCCDEYYFFKNVSPGRYQFVAKTVAGDVCPTKKNNFLFGFYQTFGYFFTCYACSVWADSTITGLQPAGVINLRYNKGRLEIVPGSGEDISRIENNLAILKKQPYEKLDAGFDQDNGLRKEFAYNLAEYYFLFGKNLVDTKKQFDAYYQFPDAEKVWKEFVSTLNGVKKSNDF